jgi:hypothetical protein
MWYVVLLLVVFGGVKGQVQHIWFLDGDYKVHLLYNQATITTDYVVLARYSYPDVWFLTVGSASNVTNVLCRSQSQQRIKWGPIGCDPPFQTSNCLASEAVREQRLAVMQEVWRFSIKENGCFLGGGDGDPRLCVGPARLALADEVDSTSGYTIGDLIRAQMVYVETLTDPLGMVPAVVETPILMPSLNVTTTCNQSYYEQTYHLDTTYPIRLTDYIAVFRGDIRPQFFIRVMKDGSGGFYISMADPDSTVDTYYSGNYPVSDYFLPWTSILPFDTLITMLPSNCTLNLTLIAAAAEWQLLPPPLLTPVNYTWNYNPRDIYQTRVCNYGIGRLGHDRSELLPFTPEGTLRGGDLLFVDPDTKLPLGVDPDPDAHYRFDCNEFYPRNESFLDYGQDGEGGARWNRMNLDIESCFSPFLVNELIRQDLNPDEKYLQCQKLGGSTYGDAVSLCFRPITQLDCPLGYYYFDQRCYTKGETGDVLVSMDTYLANWIQYWFLYQEPRLPVLYRVPQRGSQLCMLFNGSNYELLVDRSCNLRELNGQKIQNIYSIAPPPLKYKDQLISVKGALVRQKGQIGPKPNGKAALCNCFDGFTGEDCQIASCPIPTDMKTNGTLLTFYQKCYLGGRCYNMDPRNCPCNKGWGPDASLMASQPLLYQFREFPCLCPAHKETENPYFIVNQNQYTIPFIRTQQIPCGGSQHGSCYITQNSSSSQGYCLCSQRYNILLEQFEFDYMGKSCACQTPVIPWKGLSKNGPIIQSFCNNKGSCLPYKQTYQDPTGLVVAPTSEGGCDCYPGWGGTSCTCPTPLNLLAERPTKKLLLGGATYYFKDMGEKKFINYCNSTCSLLQVTNQFSANDTVSCNFEDGLWQCNTYGQLVVLSSPTCEAQCYQGYPFGYCGRENQTNALSGRFFKVASYRDAFKYQLQQPMEFATAGCTTMGCSCNPMWGGKLCNFAVSGYRLGQKLFCGEQEILPTPYNQVAGTGYLGDDGCVCNPLSAVDPTGRIGVNWAQFAGRGCQCLEVEGEMCAGHGTCEEPNYDYGWCSVDYEDYQNDPLFTPYVKRRSSVQGTTILTAEEDTFFYIYVQPPPPTPAPAPFQNPTKFPTRDPSKTPTLNPTTKSPTNPTLAVPTANPTLPTNNPTKNPTKNPTTNQPTKNPTTNPTKNPTKNPTLNPTRHPTQNPTLLGPLTLFADNTPTSTYDGNRGNRATTDSYCSSLAGAQSLSCLDAHLFASYSPTDYIGNFPIQYGFDSAAPVVGPTGTPLGAFNTIIAAPSPSLTNSLQTAAVITGTTRWWSGTDAGGVVSNTCSGWTTNSPSSTGTVGTPTTVDNTWLTFSTSTGCNLARRLVCICIN